MPSYVTTKPGFVCFPSVVVELSPCHTREVTGKNVVLEGDLRAVSLFCASRCFLLMSCLILKLSHFFIYIELMLFCQVL